MSKEVGQGAVRKTAPYWLVICVTLLAATAIPSAYIAGALVFVVVVLMVSAAFVAGMTEGLTDALPFLQDAAETMEEAANTVEELNRPFVLTGGGPLDGDTMPNPAETPSRLMVYDPDSEELEGFYVTDPERPFTLVWTPVEDDDDAA